MSDEKEIILSKLQAIIATEDSVLEKISLAKKQKETLIEEKRTLAQSKIEVLQKAVTDEINALELQSKKEIEATLKKLELDKLALNQKMEKEFQAIVEKYSDLLKKEVFNL